MRKTCGKGRMQQPPTTPSNMTTIPTKKDINPTPGNLDELKPERSRKSFF